MSTKIICPVDFSETATNAVEYAAKISLKFSAKLFLLNVKPLLVSELIGGNADELRETVMDAKKQLNHICIETNRTLGVWCDSEVAIAYSGLEKIISQVPENKSMIVMGTNGADDLYQYFFGTHTFNVLKRAKCPVILIPKNVSYFDPTQLVHVWDYEEGSKVNLEQSIHFAKLFNAPIQFLRVNENNTTLGQAEELLKKENISHSFEQIYSNDITEGINQYMGKNESSLLVFPIQEQGIIESIFKKNNVKKLSATISYPVIFIHEDVTENNRLN